MNITFLGAAREVTGSCFLVEASDLCFLVDCGMFQGGEASHRHNFEALDLDLGKINFVLLTHAHIDHSGLLPRLTAMGYKGPIITTYATTDLLAVMLPDSGHIQEKETEWLNFREHRGQGRHRPETPPLYTVAQAQDCLKRLRPVAYDEPVRPHPQAQCRFRDAGHILGSAIIECSVTENGATKKLVFSGDIGQPGHPIVRDPTLIEQADVLLVESTYGNRLHKGREETLNELVYAVEHTLRRKRGNIVIPAFAVGRTQDLLYLLADLERQGRLGKSDIYVDSPMATSATQITLKHLDLADTETRALMSARTTRDFLRRVHFVEDVEESKSLNEVASGAIIISASGMCEAGRIKHHLKHNLSRPECGILITGFQAAGTLGRRLVDGADSVRIFGQDVPVRADIYTVGGLSAHADQAGLLSWLRSFKQPPGRTFIVHGEESTALSFADTVQRELRWAVEVPRQGDVVEV